MRVDKNVGFFAGNDENVKAQRELQQGKKADGKGGKELKSISASDLTLQGQDEAVIKKLQARKQAMKIVMDQFSSDDETDMKVKELKERNKELDGTILESMKEIDKIEENRNTAAEAYGIDLSTYKKGTNEEFDNTMKVLDEQKGALNEKIEEYKKEMYENTAYVDSVSKARLKGAPMLAAQKTAEKITDSASKEIIGILINDAKDHVDEEIEKKEEEAEEIKEKQEEQEEIKNANSAAPQKDPAAESLSNIKKADTLQKKLEEEINSMLNNKKILEEDLKGLALDEQK